MTLIETLKKLASSPVVAKDPQIELEEAFNLARADWREKYPHSYATPWDGISCDFDFTGERAWLNPSHQQHLNYGGFTVGQYQDWLNGKVVEGGIIMSQEKWDELLWICKTGGGACLIGYEIENYNMFPPEYLLSPGQVFQPGDESTRKVGTGLPQRLQLPKDEKSWLPQRLSPELIEAVEKYIKYIYLKDMEEQVSWGRSDIHSVHISREAEEEAYGFTRCLNCLGLETMPGVSNLPAHRENFSYWRCLLKNEAKWELWIKNGIAYEPWVKNRKSTYSHK